MNVKRYWISPNGIACEDSEGKFVRYEDYAALEARYLELATENAGLKSNLMYWNSEDAEPARSPLDIAHESSFGEGVEFDVQVAARMPSMTYRVVRRTTYSTEIELVSCGMPETPATGAFLAEVRAQGVEMVIAAKKHQKGIMHTDTFAYGAAQESLRNLINELELFAAQLRREAAQ